MTGRDWFDWTGRTGRGRFALVFCLATGAALVLSSMDPLGPFMVVGFPLMALLTYGAIVQTRRRLRDVAWAGGLVWVAAVPVIALFFAGMLAFKRSAPEPGRLPSGLSLRIGQGLAVLFCVLIASRALWAPFWSPSGSMKPTLLVGDYYAVLRSSGTPEPGSLLVFRHPVDGSDFVKRMIAGPGDTVQMQDGRVILNGQELAQAADGMFIEPFERQGPLGVLPACRSVVAQGAPCEKMRWIETHANGTRYAVLDIDARRSDSTGVLRVPEGHIFVLGDNRDNSLDSRMPRAVGGVGFVPLDNVKGQVSRVLFNMDGVPNRVWLEVR